VVSGLERVQKIVWDLILSQTKGICKELFLFDLGWGGTRRA